jgi:hypothetical protein
MLRPASSGQHDPSVLRPPVRPPITRTPGEAGSRPPLAGGDAAFARRYCAGEAGRTGKGYWTRRIVFASDQCRSSW